jgi:hypothetical protein
VGGGVQLGPLGTAATDWPIVPAPGDYDDGEFSRMKIGRRNRSTRRKPAQTPATNRFSYGAAICISLKFWWQNHLKRGDLLDQGKKGRTILKLILKKIYEEGRRKVTQGCVKGFGVSAVEP